MPQVSPKSNCQNRWISVYLKKAENVSCCQLTVGIQGSHKLSTKWGFIILTEGRDAEIF